MPDWMRLALAAYSREGPSPAQSFNIRIPGDEAQAVIHVQGGPDGTSVTARRAAVLHSVLFVLGFGVVFMRPPGCFVVIDSWSQVLVRSSSPNQGGAA